MKYDYLVVGAGLFGATFAQQAKELYQSRKVDISDIFQPFSFSEVDTFSEVLD